MNRMRRNPWARGGFYAWSLGFEASSVIALRTLKIAIGGPAAEAEMRRMVIEKIEAGLTLQALALTGGLGRSAHSAATKTLADYRRNARANRRRRQGMSCQDNHSMPLRLASHGWPDPR
jgi:hypothetical protein